MAEPAQRFRMPGIADRFRCDPFNLDPNQDVPEPVQLTVLTK